MVTFRQFFDLESSTYTYLLADQELQCAALIDPVKEQAGRDLKTLDELGLKLRYAIDTHVHADHISALGLLRERTGCQTAMAASGGADCADIGLVDGQELQLGALSLRALTTPGHTQGCLSFYVPKLGMVFTGDALLIRGCGRTDFQQGDAATLYKSVWTKLFTLPAETLVFPGHDYKGLTASSIGEEKRWNPRLSKPEAKFIEIMKSLNLPQPKKIQDAVPANLACGKATPAVP